MKHSARPLLRRTLATLILPILLTMHTHAQLTDPGRFTYYGGGDLGLTYSPSGSSFRIWSPLAEAVELLLYVQDLGGLPLKTIAMENGGSGTWHTRLTGDQKGLYYAFRVRINGRWGMEVPDPYAKLVGTNGKRAVVGDLRDTDPPGWEKDTPPTFRLDASGKPAKGGSSATDAVIYELHIRDASMHASSGIRARGRFLGLAETGTRSPQGLSTGIDHLREMGVTHVHLLPSYDFHSVDEQRPDSAQYNWGYDPVNYNTPEGSYSTNPSDGLTRVREFKRLIQTLHSQGIRVVMDVVYNHTMFSETSLFSQLVPGYYYRMRPDGSFSDASACGNETASERPMMRKFILESVTYWVKEFHVDGFRFDLMGIHDIETMNLVSRELHALRPDILLYGEGWTAGSSPLDDSLRALKRNAARLDRIAVFSDDIRDGIKGSVFVHGENGFASGRKGLEESIKFGVVAATKHPQVDYAKVNYSKAPYAAGPHQVISYAECHDNHILWDKLALSTGDADTATRIRMQKLAFSIVLTAQGIPFLHAGSEFLRSKKGVENSFKSGDDVNAIDWNLKHRHREVYEYVRGLIRMRRTHPAFRMRDSASISRHLEFFDGLPDRMVAYTIDGAAVGDEWSQIIIAYNGAAEGRSLKIPPGSWNVFTTGGRIVKKGRKVKDEARVEAHSTTILYRD